MAFHYNWLCRFAAIKVVSIHDKKLAVTFWGTSILSVLFSIYCMIAYKGYQASDTAVSTMSIKVKGNAHLSNNKTFIFDETDLIHNIDSETIFIETAFYQSHNPIGHPHGQYHGHQLNRIDTNDLEQWTIYWRQDLFFPQYHYKASTAVKNRSSVTDAEKQNFISLKDIISEIGDYDLKDMAETGAIIKITDDWSCNLDKSDPKKQCVKHRRIRRLDTDGFNYWVKVNDDGENKKIEKRYGIKLVFAVTGVAGKFSWFSLFVAVGAAFAYIAVIRLITDFVLMYCMTEKFKYYNQKYEHLYYDDEKEKWILGPSLMAPDPKPPLNQLFESFKI